MRPLFAVDLGGTAVKYAVLDDQLNLLESGQVDTPYQGADALVDLLAELCRSCSSGNRDFRGICVSVPGGVSGTDDGTVFRGGKLRYLHQVPLGQLLRIRTGLPCTVENDGRAGILGECHSGVLRGCTSGAMIVLGTSVGGGILLDGRLLRGSQDFAGRFAHILTSGQAEEVQASSIGMLLGKDGLRRDILDAMGLQDNESISGQQLFDWINAGDLNARSGLSRYCRKLALLISNLQVILDPQVIAIGGGISQQPALIDVLKEQLEELQTCYPIPLPRPNVLPARSGNSANLIGSGVVWLHRYGSAQEVSSL